MTIEGTYRRDRTSAAEHVVNDLRGQILSRRLERGTRLPSERELAVRYDVSPPTIREAIRALSATNLVEARHGAGTFVTADGEALIATALAAVVQLEDVDLPSIIELSEGFYLHAAQLAVTEATDAELAGLHRSAEAFRGPLDADAFAEALRTFLVALVSVSHNRLLIVLSRFVIDTQIGLAMAASQRSSTVWQNIAGRLVEERLEIADALQRRDADSARNAVVVYMRRAHALVREHGVASGAAEGQDRVLDVVGDEPQEPAGDAAVAHPMVERQ